MLSELGNGDSPNGKGWEFLTSVTRKEAPVPKVILVRRIYTTVHVKLQKSFSILVACEELEVVFKESPKQAISELYGSTKRKGSE